MTDAIYHPRELGDVLDRALDRCFERIDAGEKESIAFMVILDRGGEITDQRIAIELTEGEIRPLGCRLECDQADIIIYALAFDGQVLWKEKLQDAILIEVAERENDECLLLAQRYALREGRKPRFRLKGRVELVATNRSRIYECDEQGERTEA